MISVPVGRLLAGSVARCHFVAVGTAKGVEVR